MPRAAIRAGMIFERRVYTLRPGHLAAFWDAQGQWNTEKVFGPLRAHCLGYFSAISAESERVVHLYAFETLDQWQTRYADYYKAQSPDYFAQVRPWMSRQDNGFFAAPPQTPGDWLWNRERWPLFDRAGSPCLLETIIDFRPGGLPAFWRAWEDVGRTLNEGSGPYPPALLVSVIGRQHRLFLYRPFVCPEDAIAFQAGRAGDTRWAAWSAGYAGWIGEERETLLFPSPMASRRPMFAHPAATD